MRYRPGRRLLATAAFALAFAAGPGVPASTAQAAEPPTVDFTMPDAVVPAGGLAQIGIFPGGHPVTDLRSVSVTYTISGSTTGLSMAGDPDFGGQCKPAAAAPPRRRSWSEPRGSSRSPTRPSRNGSRATSRPARRPQRARPAR